MEKSNFTENEARGLLENILAIIEKYYGIKKSRLFDSDNREAHITRARSIIMNVLHQRVDIGPSMIARLINTNHSSVSIAINHFKTNHSQSPEYRSMYLTVISQLNINYAENAQDYLELVSLLHEREKLNILISQKITKLKETDTRFLSHLTKFDQE